MAVRLTLVNGEVHICRDSTGSAYVDLDGDWIDKDSAAIAKVERGRLKFEPDEMDEK